MGFLKNLPFLRQDALRELRCFQEILGTTIIIMWTYHSLWHIYIWYRYSIFIINYTWSKIIEYLGDTLNYIHILYILYHYVMIISIATSTADATWRWSARRALRARPGAPPGRRGGGAALGDAVAGRGELFPWGKHGKTMGKPWRKPGKPWKNYGNLRFFWTFWIFLVGLLIVFWFLILCYGLEMAWTTNDWWYLTTKKWIYIYIHTAMGYNIIWWNMIFMYRDILVFMGVSKSLGEHSKIHWLIILTRASKKPAMNKCHQFTFWYWLTVHELQNHHFS